MRTCVLRCDCFFLRLSCSPPRLTVLLPALPDVHLSVQREVQVQPLVPLQFGERGHIRQRHTPHSVHHGQGFLQVEDFVVASVILATCQGQGCSGRFLKMVADNSQTFIQVLFDSCMSNRNETQRLRLSEGMFRDSSKSLSNSSSASKEVIFPKENGNFFCRRWTNKICWSPP